MVSSELGACEWFVWDLRRSGLIDRGQLDQVIGEFLKRNPRAEPPALAEYLVGQGILSPFQAERILAGKTQGLVLGPYVLADSIGAGSMGQVYKASSKTDNQWYAVKVLPRRSMWNVRLARRQVRAFSQFSNPVVVPFVDVGTSGGLHYLVWPFVSGETLEAKVQRENKLKPDEVARLCLQLGQALNVCQQNGIFHGLLKPSNIMIGSDDQPKLLDFGIGSLLAENEGESLVDTMSTANTLTSGLDCSSPESIMEPTNRTPAGDQYSLGCILYFALAGRYPFPEGTAVEKMMAHQFKQPTPLRELVGGVPEGLVHIIERLMQKTPEARFATMDDLVDAIHPIVGDSTPLPAAGSHFGAGSRFGQSIAGQSRFGVVAPRASTPLPGPGGIPLPRQHTPSAIHSTTAASTPPAAPIGQRITPPAAPKAPPLASAPTSKPLPTRQTVHPASAQTEQVQVMLSAGTTPMPAPGKAPQSQTAPGWIPDETKVSFGPLLIILITALVIVLTYMLGKNFIFPTG